jgi:hypothetical protein
VAKRRQTDATPVIVTVMIVLSLGAIVECEIVGYRSPISLVDQMRRVFSSKGIRAEVSLRGDIVVVKEIV